MKNYLFIQWLLVEYFSGDWNLFIVIDDMEMHFILIYTHTLKTLENKSTPPVLPMLSLQSCLKTHLGRISPLALSP